MPMTNFVQDLLRLLIGNWYMYLRCIGGGKCMLDMFYVHMCMNVAQHGKGKHVNVTNANVHWQG